MNPHLSDHSAIHSKLSLTRAARARPPKVKKQYRKIRGVDPIEFRNDVMVSSLFSSPACNLNDLCHQYDSELSKVVDVHAPLKTRFVTSRPSVPWYSEEIAAKRLVCYTVVFSAVTQRSSPLTDAENRTTFLSLCVCGLTNKPIMYKKLDNT